MVKELQIGLPVAEEEQKKQNSAGELDGAIRRSHDLDRATIPFRLASSKDRAVCDLSR